MSVQDLLGEGFRWFGPGDPVPLAYIRQAGAREVFTSLHEIPYGEVWPRVAIRERRELIEAAGLRWSVVESVPVHEDIKAGGARVSEWLENYAQTLRHLAAEGIHVVVYNFMPVLDWVRTDMRWKLPDGSECMRFNPVKSAAFDIHALRRKGAEDDYSLAQIELAQRWWQTLKVKGQEELAQSIIDVFPGVKWGLSLEDVREMLERYRKVDEVMLQGNLSRFLEAVVPVAEEVGVRLAIHPDDPPFPVLGLPRVVSTKEHVEAVFKMVDSPANGLCFCTGSFSARVDNDVISMAELFAPRIHAVHLRNTQLCADGSFFEADHLAGSVDMPAVMRVLLEELDCRRRAGRVDWQMPFRPDHGHTMMDDLLKPAGITPGYSCIGRMRGLAELRGVMHGVREMM